jgi:hypothetical protein
VLINKIGVTLAMQKLNALLVWILGDLAGYSVRQQLRLTSKSYFNHQRIPLHL